MGLPPSSARTCRTRGRTQKLKELGEYSISWGNLRAKYSRDGWECGEGERTVLRKLDHGEDDGGGLHVDFARLRQVSAHLSNLTSDSKKNLYEDWVHDNLHFILITMVPTADAGPPSGA